MANNILQAGRLKLGRVAVCLVIMLGISFISKASGPVNMPLPVTDTVPPPANATTTSTPATTATTTTAATVSTVTEGVIKEVPKSKKQVKPIAVNTISVPASGIVKPKIVVKPIIKIH